MARTKQTERRVPRQVYKQARGRDLPKSPLQNHQLGVGGKRMVFVHLEYLHFSSSPGLHLTQLAVVSPGHEAVFSPVLPSVLPDILDNYKVDGDLMRALSLTRKDNTFQFGSYVLLENVSRTACVSETKGLQKFIEHLENVGPNVILVGLDEATLGVLMQKLVGENRVRALKQVEGCTWWGRILEHSGSQDKDLSLKDSTFSSPFGSPPTCAQVAERLMASVKEVTFRQCVLAVDSSKPVSEVVVPVNGQFGMEERDVVIDLVTEKEVVKVVNSYLSIPYSSFEARKIEQVNIDESGDQRSEVMIMKQEVKKTGIAPSSEWSKFMNYDDEHDLPPMPHAAPPPLPRSGSSLSSAADQDSSLEMGVLNKNDLLILLESPLTYDSSNEQRGNLEKYPQVFDLADHHKKLLKETREERNGKKKEKKRRDYLRKKEEQRKKWAVGTRKLTDFFVAFN